MWFSDGTVEGTRLVKDINPGPGSSEPSIWDMGAQALFGAGDAEHGVELWATDGSEAGTYLVMDINPGPASSMFYSSERFGERLFFSENDAVHGEEMWVAEWDGARYQARLVKNLWPGPKSASPYNLVKDTEAEGAFVAEEPGMRRWMYKLRVSPTEIALERFLDPALR